MQFTHTLPMTPSVLHFIDEETEAWRGYLTCLKSTNWLNSVHLLKLALCGHAIQMDSKVSGIFPNVAERRGLGNSTRFRPKQEKPTVLTVLNVKVKRDY